MIFVSYSHQDEKWRSRFEIMSKPLSRAEGIVFWSDRNIKAGEWEPQIQREMETSEVAVLLVSDSFLASDYIMDKELPFLSKAHDSRALMIVWAYLEPCDVKRYPEIQRFQAMTRGTLEPMSKMTDWQWKETMLKGCDMIDEFLKDLERPDVNLKITGKPFPRVSNIPILAKPSRRLVEVLVYSSEKNWWRQPPIKVGTTTTKMYLGNNNTESGVAFPVVAITTERPLTRQTYTNLPDYRTKSKEIKLVRA